MLKLPSGSILFTSSFSGFSYGIIGFEIFFKKNIARNIPTHCEVYFKDIGVVSAQFPVVCIKKPADDYLYVLHNQKLKGKKLTEFRETILQRVGAPYDVISIVKFMPILENFMLSIINSITKKNINELPQIGYNCVSLFRGLVPFEVDNLTVVEFMNELQRHGWKAYNFSQFIRR